LNDLPGADAHAGEFVPLKADGVSHPVRKSCGGYWGLISKPRRDIWQRPALANLVISIPQLVGLLCCFVRYWVYRLRPNTHRPGLRTIAENRTRRLLGVDIHRIVPMVHHSGLFRPRRHPVCSITAAHPFMGEALGHLRQVVGAGNI
jgi:hypothetical protein